METQRMTDGSTIQTGTRTVYIATCGQTDWQSGDCTDYFDALNKLSVHVYQTHLPSTTEVAGKRDPRRPWERD